MTELNKKRGISDVVTTVLIILLALAAVVILWSFLKPQVTQAGTEITGQGACLQLDLKANSCVYNADPDGNPSTDDGVIDVTLEKVAGDVNLVDVKLLIDMADETRIVNASAFDNNIPGLYGIETVSDIFVGEEPKQTIVVGVIEIDGVRTDCAQSTPAICS